MIPLVVCLFALLLSAQPAGADEVLVAVAANFTPAMATLEPVFERDSGHQLQLVSGSTGKLYAQIRHGAPFHVFLAADQARPQRLDAEGFGVPGSRFSYAIGRLALYSSESDLIADGPSALEQPEAGRIAIANPDLAPYGAAARQTLEHLGLWQTLSRRLVIGQNVGEVFAMVATGNARLGFVALSSLLASPEGGSGSYWEVPAGCHDPIRQDAILLARGRNVEGAQALLRFLRSDEVQNRLGALGYEPIRTSGPLSVSKTLRN